VIASLTTADGTGQPENKTATPLADASPSQRE